MRRDHANTAGHVIGITQVPPPSANAAEPSAAFSAAPAPTPPPDPEAVRKAAAAAYLKAATRYNKVRTRLNNKYKVFYTLAQARAYYKAAADNEGTFIADVKGIAMPPGSAGDLHDLIRAAAAEQAGLIGGRKVRSWAAEASADSEEGKNNRRVSAAGNLVRADLGLPPVPG